MFSRWAKVILRPHGMTAVLTLVGHLFIASGLPLPAPPFVRLKDSSRPFPCQDRPCGCRTYDECWKGDCCCFTLEEKLAWAEANDIEPPQHVRPLVEARKSRQSLPAKQHCCLEEENRAGAHLSIAGCPCHGSRNDKPAESATGCTPTGRTEIPAPACSECNARYPQECRDKSKSVRPGVRWVVGIFAQKCRGQGPAGLLQLAPSVPAEVTPLKILARQLAGHVVSHPVRIAFTSRRPPTPPPRRS